VKLVDAAWPVADDNLAILEEITIAVQLNGKMRGSFVTSPGADPSFLEQQALALPVVVRDRGERPIRRIVVVPDRIVNIVL
jgi:leucyl-tRNA synthetase